MSSKNEPWIFSLPDLREFPERSVPSPYGFMNPVRRLPPGLRLVAAGWLDGPIEFPQGATHPDVVSKLLNLGEAFLIDEGTRGWHSCYYCKPEAFREVRRGANSPWANRPKSPLSHGHHLVRLGEVVYMCPALLPHYIVAHGYRPPDVFQDAVRHGTFLADGDLVHTGEDFMELSFQQAVAAAEAAGDAERATDYRARIEARREELRLAGKKSGFRDRDTGVWRDDTENVASCPRPSSVTRSSHVRTPHLDRVLLGQADPVATSEQPNRLLAWLRRRWRT